MTKMTLQLLTVAALAVWSLPAQAQKYSTKLLEHEVTIDHIIEGMTLEEKIDMLHGKNMFCRLASPV